jgi:hypothetical protein
VELHQVCPVAAANHGRRIIIPTCGTLCGEILTDDREPPLHALGVAVVSILVMIDELSTTLAPVDPTTDGPTQPSSSRNTHATIASAEREALTVPSDGRRRC